MTLVPDHGGFLVGEGDLCIGAVHCSYWSWPDGHVDRAWIVDSAYEPISRQFPTLALAADAITEAWERRYGGAGA